MSDTLPGIEMNPCGQITLVLLIMDLGERAWLRTSNVIEPKRDDFMEALRAVIVEAGEAGELG